MHRKAICLAWPFENVTNADHLDFRNSSTGKGSGSSSSLSLSFMRRSIRNLHNCSRASAEKEKKEDSQLHAEELGRGTGGLGKTCQAPPHSPSCKQSSWGNWGRPAKPHPRHKPWEGESFCPSPVHRLSAWFTTAVHTGNRSESKRDATWWGVLLFSSPLRPFITRPSFPTGIAYFPTTTKKRTKWRACGQAILPNAN